MNNQKVTTKNSKIEYELRVNHFTRLMKKHREKARRLSNLRLLVSLAGIGFAIFFFVSGLTPSGTVTIIAALAVFIFLVFKHQQAKRDSDYAALMKKINEDSLKRLLGEWNSFPDTGKEFCEDNHPFTSDLDIFGINSLFQWISIAHTYLGRRRLAHILARPPENSKEIKARQEAVQELARKLKWRQQFQVEGIISSDKAQDPKDLIQWGKKANPFFRRREVIFALRFLPACTILSIILSLFFSQSVSYLIPVGLILVQTAILFFLRKDTGSTFAIAHQYKENIKGYHRMLEIFETAQFRSPYLVNLNKKLEGDKKLPAYQQIKKLEKAVDMTYMRYSQLYFIFNIITMWDFQCQIALEKWKDQSGPHLQKWLETIGEIESLSSVAVISFDHPDWAVPEILDDYTGLLAKDLAHPLLPETRIPNDLSITSPGEIFLITGSNMSGKSTLLRTAGINLVLGYAGSPVCAKEFRSGLMDIYTSMRINDDLRANISSFYGELLRIKLVLDATRKKRPVFILLDEIFRGTNSRDRHTGAKHLIKKLSRGGALGLVSTHDLELADLAQDKDAKIKNYHFEEYYRDGKLLFDYILRPGVSTTKNAIFLMKMAGIEITD
ncbi:MAG: DNA mismatch repair protein MutS [Desulfitobacteriaceae bacterium]|nr:DNA mismatch repair protein MutS [Desulfitobacteriaceae bacterium]